MSFKLKVPLLEIDLAALWHRASSRRDPVTIAARRFLNLFAEHGVVSTQIPRLLPQVGLDKLRTPEALLPALSGELLQRTADLFGVRRAWLEGVDDILYPHRRCYKRPRDFFEDLTRVDPKRTAPMPVRVLYSGQPPDLSVTYHQFLCLILVEPLPDAGDGQEEQICRYHVYYDQWDWSHPPCRIQLKAMARLVDQLWGRPVPMHRVKPATLKAVCEGRRVPRALLEGPLLTDPSLEDYSLSIAESSRSREEGELGAVFDYIAKSGLKGLSA